MPALIPALNDKDLNKIIISIQQLAQGRNNAIGTVTLDLNVGKTTVTAPNCGNESTVVLFPQSVNAAAEFVAGTLRIGSVSNGSFVITHVNSATANRIFRWVALG